MAQFDTEVATYAANKVRLLADGLEGQFVLIRGSGVVGIYATADLAYRAGLEKFGNVPMFIKPLTKEEITQSSPALFLGVMNVHL